MKIGLLGGTFNPVHTGHLILAQECWAALDLERVVFIPAYIPPHKPLACDVSAPDRLNMLRLALEGDERFDISTFEIDKGGRSYSIDTIRYIEQLYRGRAEIFFLTGADSADTLPAWKDIDNILEKVNFVIATRPRWSGITPFEARVTRITMPSIDISSSDIRERIEGRQPIDFLVPEKVVRYIRKKGLYRSAR
ncbi:MAG: nicotinate-nucleotide adenylyltransferase [Candidatus Omnitrophica bacterium]|nr:nicotinate-nucleotide adenylyltransferase [Candidatus Omnitrophota bacterium]